MLQKITGALKKPTVYTKTQGDFWNDEYISGQMLKAHLDPEFEGASRKKSFIEKSVSWIRKMVPPANYPMLLDVGCGPGIYAEKFTGAGFRVTGIDFSRRSIEYARASAEKQGLDITYKYQDYLQMEDSEKFDFAAMIYCDYGALSTADRKTIMNKVYNSLRPGGKFLLDVFSAAKYDNFQEDQTWEICKAGGFWREEEYIALKGRYKYSDYVTLEQICVMTEGEWMGYYIWNTCFTREALANEAGEAGFRVCGIFSDVAGKVYSKDSVTLAVLLEK